MLRRNGDTNMDMVGHQMPFDDLTLLLFCQRVEDPAQLLAHLSEQDLPSPFGYEHYMDICSPILNVGEDSTPATVKPFLVSLVEPVAYQLS